MPKTVNSIIQICSGITRGRVLNGEHFYIKITEVNLFAFAYRLFHEDFSPIDGAFLSCCPDCPSCSANAIQMGWATLAIWAVIKKYSLNL